MMRSRIRKTGLDYFSLDVDFYSDPKIVFLDKEFGGDGIKLWLLMHCAIYREGYFLPLREIDLEYMVLRWGFCRDRAVEILSHCLDLGIFHKGLYEKYGILTSASIQSRHAMATRQRRVNDVIQEYLLIPIEDISYHNIIPLVDRHFSEPPKLEPTGEPKPSKKKTKAVYDSESTEWQIADTVRGLIKKNYAIKDTPAIRQKECVCIAHLLEAGKTADYIVRAANFAANDKENDMGSWKGWYQQFRSVTKLADRDKQGTMYVDLWNEKATALPFEVATHECVDCRDTGHVVTSSTPKWVRTRRCVMCEKFTDNVDEAVFRKSWNVPKSAKWERE